jgi:hypothetical protein
MATDQFGAKLPDGVMGRLGTVGPSREGDRVSALAFSPDDRTVASGGEDGSIRLWDVATSRELRRFGEHPKQVGAIAFAPGGQLLVSGSFDGTIIVWDVPTGQERLTIQAPAGLLAFFLVDDNTLLAGCRDEMYRAWDLSSGSELGQDPTHLGPVQALAFSPDGRSVVTGSWERAVRLCDQATGQEVKQFPGHKSSVQSAVVSADGRTVISAGPDETVRFWEVLTVKERMQYQGQKEGVFAMAWSADCRLLASSAHDTTILLWDVTAPPQARAPQRQVGRLLPSQLEALWQELLSPDAPTAYRAIWGVATAARDTVPFLKRRLAQLVPVDRQRMSVLLGEISHDQVTRRDKAVQELEKVGALCEPMLRTALQKPPSVDARRRLEKLLAKAQGAVPSPDTLHTLRAVEALEMANTAEARQVLESLSREAPPTCVTAEAKGSLERLAKRPVLPG